MTYERNGVGRGWDGVGDEQHEHGECEEDGETETDLLSRAARQTERQRRQHAEHHARPDHVERVVERTAPDVYRVRQLRVRVVVRLVVVVVPR